jgi:hypothetical protein
MSEKIFLTFTNATAIRYLGSVLGRHIVLNYIDQRRSPYRCNFPVLRRVAKQMLGRDVLRMNHGFPSDPARNDMQNRRWLAGRVTALGALFLCLALVSSARADSASCLAKVSSYVAELDELLTKKIYRLTPYNDLHERYFPFRDCEAEALVEEVRKSNFVRWIGYDPHTKTYFIHIRSDEVEVDFVYYVSERKTDPGSNITGWVHK